MALEASQVRDLTQLGLLVERGIPLSSLGSFQLGGPASCVIRAPDVESLGKVRSYLTEAGLPSLLIGEGTNLLFSDWGWEGILVRCADGSGFPEHLEGGRYRVSASMSLENLVDWAISASVSGLEPFAGIPGTVGGAVVGNAGAWGVQIADRLMEVSGWFQNGEPFRLSGDECGFSYRDSMLKHENAWVSEVVLQTSPGDAEALRSEKNRILSERSARHPEWRTTPCIGSFFKNLAPTSAAGRRQAAGWFLEQAGAKAMSVGGAEVFSGHANIPIKAHESCSARDVALLADEMKAAVQQVHGIGLEREVRYLGNLPGYEGQPGFW